MLDPGGDNPWDDIGVPEIAEYHCTMREIVFDVPYEYGSDNGNQVQLWVIASNGGEKIASGFATVEHGSSVAPVKMELVDPSQEATSSELSMFYLTLEGENVYSERIEREMRWPRPKPDLLVEDIQVGWGENAAALAIDVRNRGCAPLDGFNMVLHRQDGHSFTREFDVHIAERTTERVTIDLGFDVNPYGRMFWVILDPDDVIDEIDEENNLYLKQPIMLNQIHIHSIDIHTTSDGEWHQDADEGEFYMFFVAQEQQVRRPVVDGMNWVLQKGHYEIDGHFTPPVVFSPSLNWDEDLFIQVRVFEHDDLFDMNDMVCWVEFVHSWDMNDPDSWKGGGEFSAEEPGRCTVYWRLDAE